MFLKEELRLCIWPEESFANNNDSSTELKSMGLKIANGFLFQ